MSHKTLPWLSCSHCRPLFNQDSKSWRQTPSSRRRSPGGTSANMVNFTWVGKWAQWPWPVLGKDKKSTYCATCAIHNGIMRLVCKRSATHTTRSLSLVDVAPFEKKPLIITMEIHPVEEVSALLFVFKQVLLRRRTTGEPR